MRDLFTHPTDTQVIPGHPAPLCSILPLPSVPPMIASLYHLSSSSSLHPLLLFFCTTSYNRCLFIPSLYFVLPLLYFSSLFYLHFFTLSYFLFVCLLFFSPFFSFLLSTASYTFPPSLISWPSHPYSYFFSFFFRLFNPLILFLFSFHLLLLIPPMAASLSSPSILNLLYELLYLTLPFHLSFSFP